MSKVYETFDKALAAYGLSELIVSQGLVKRVPLNALKLVNAIGDIVKTNKRVFIDPDCDPDGFFSGLIVKTTFDKVGFSNYTIPLHINKRHTLSQTFLTSIVEGGYDAVLILDSSSNDMEGIRFLCSHKVQVLIIDHHDTNFVFKDYPPECVIVNPRIDRRFKPVDYAELSAGALTALLCDMVLQTVFGIGNNKELYVYGYTTLYSDSCNMANKTNRDFAFEYKDFAIIPEILDIFMTRFDSFNRNFVSWKFIPRINALIRAEEFDFVYKLFYDRHELMMNKESTLAFVEQVYASSKKKAAEFEGLGRLIELKNIVCMELPSSLYQYYRNYTGLIASQLATGYGKVGVCVVGASYNSLEGSVRDTLNRDLKGSFQTLCYAEGHPSAFGIEVPVGQLENILSVADSMEEIFKAEAEMMIVDWDSSNPTREMAETEIYHMAMYNELSGGSLPVAYAMLTLHDAFKFKQYGKCSRAEYNNFKFVSFKHSLVPGVRVICKPMFSGMNPEMIVEAII